eukprot:11549022-Heterocapsa_arctica.AAC.1
MQVCDCIWLLVGGQGCSRKVHMLAFSHHFVEQPLHFVAPGCGKDETRVLNKIWEFQEQLEANMLCELNEVKYSTV